MIINWMKYRLFYALVSGIFIAVSVFSLLNWGLALGIDFRGGILVEYQFSKELSTESATALLADNNIEVGSIQQIGENNYLFRLGEIDQSQRERILELLNEEEGQEASEVRFERVGPSIGPELVKKTIYALIVSTLAILSWVALQFRSIKFGTSAILAMLHDNFILIGLFSLLGHFFSAEADFLFVTALLTTLSFSVHDTIVVFDRIREIRKKHGGTIEEVANRALTETMRRSINNSVTIALMLAALMFFGGSTIFWFAAALLMGTILGTYSSPFVAVPTLVLWERMQKRLKK